MKSLLQRQKNIINSSIREARRTKTQLEPKEYKVIKNKSPVRNRKQIWIKKESLEFQKLNQKSQNTKKQKHYKSLSRSPSERSHYNHRQRSRESSYSRQYHSRSRSRSRSREKQVSYSRYRYRSRSRSRSRKKKKQNKKNKIKEQKTQRNQTSSLIIDEKDIVKESESKRLILQPVQRIQQAIMQQRRQEEVYDIYEDFMEDEIKNDKFLTKKLQDLEQQIYLTIDVRTITNDKYPQKKWVPRGDKDKHMIRHFGQRKLFMSELYFLTMYGSLSDIVIYAGAAPGHHIKFLVELFPNHKFILVDPREFNIQESERVQIIQEYFTDDLCTFFAEQFEESGVLFISDIRTADKTSMKMEEHEEHIDKDNKQQRKWVFLMKPKKALLKFRCPYSDYKGTKSTKMYNGDIYVQPWAPQSSTESRLITDANQIMINYDHLVYEEKFFYHNDETRKKRFVNPIKGEGLYNDYDSCSDVIQLWYYLRQYGKQLFKNVNFSLYKQICILSKQITDSIGMRKYLGRYNLPKEQRPVYQQEIDHRQFYLNQDQNNYDNQNSNLYSEEEDLQ